MSLIAYILGVARQVFVSCLLWTRHAHAYWTTPLLCQPEPGKRFSAAQRCNEDVIREIFANLPLHTLASAARVCRAWLPAARDRLYRDVLVDNILASRPEKLAETLYTNPLIRSLVRRPVLRHADMGQRNPALFDWIALLPEHSFLSVEIEIMTVSPKKPLTTFMTLLDLPAIHTTPRLVIRCMTYITPKRFNQVLSMPYLDSLSINIPERTAIYLNNLLAFPKLRRLSIRADTYTPLICNLLRGLPSPLTRFDLRSKNLTHANIDALCQALVRHAPHLQHLAFLGEPFSTLCFVDDLAPSFTSLESLLCADHLYSPTIFAQLPPTLTSLALCTPNAWADSLPADQYAAALQKHRSRLPRLREIVIVNGRHGPLKCDPLPAVCEVEGIAFRSPTIGSVERDLLG